MSHNNEREKGGISTQGSEGKDRNGEKRSAPQDQPKKRQHVNKSGQKVEEKIKTGVERGKHQVAKNLGGSKKTKSRRTDLRVERRHVAPTPRLNQTSDDAFTSLEPCLTWKPKKH